MFTCSKSIIKTEVHCAKFVQSWQERHQIKCVKLNFSKCFNILLIWLLSTLIIFIAIYVIPIVIPQFPSWFSALTPWFPTFFAFPPIFLAFPRYSHADSPHFHPHSSHSYLYSSHSSHFILQLPISGFTDNQHSL